MAPAAGRPQAAGAPPFFSSAPSAAPRPNANGLWIARRPGVLQRAAESNAGKQPLISNFFAAGAAAATAGHTLEDNPTAAYLSKCVVTYKGGEFAAVTPDGKVVGRLAIYEDQNGGHWINNIEVLGQARRAGIGTLLIQAAKKEFGHIYASNSHIDPGGADDTRHLSAEGAALVGRMIDLKIMDMGWLKAPVK